MSSASDSLATIAAAARTAAGQESLHETLQTIARAASLSVPGFDHAGISLIDRQGHIETIAASDDLVLQLDRLQYQHGEGPCVSAMREQPFVVVPRTRHEQRWPSYIPPAVALGLRAQLAVRLFLDHSGSMGGLNLYSTTEDEIHPDAENIADLIAAHAAVALDQLREVQHLNDALQTRTVIGQAAGIVMERYDLDEDAAFAYLLRASSHTNVKLRTIAERLVEERTTRRVPAD